MGESMRRIATSIILAAALATGTIVLGACASGGGGTEAAQPAATPIPANSPLAKIKPGMSDEQVRGLLGGPDDSRSYMTGKAFIPFYYGPDTHRADWIYKGKGRVVFRRNRYTGGLEVIRALYDPNEAGNSPSGRAGVIG
jgi:hypothetical protein